jgi:uncharacterized protein
MSLDVAPQQAQLDELCSRHHVRRLDLFGSATTDRYDASESDLDFLVEFEPLPAGTYFDTYFDLREALEQLFGRPVDLVVASAITNPYFRQSVDQTRVLLYAS